MPVFDTSITVAAPLDVCWHVLTTTSEYGAWNPDVPKLSGTLALNATLTLHLRLLGKVAMPAPVEVLTLEAPRALRWRSKQLPLLMSVDHSFLLEPSGAGTLFRNLETFSGPMPAASALMIRAYMPSRYSAFNQAFKQRCERLLLTDAK